jgi:cell division protein FtsI (penicillin-binding protein 3)
MVVNAGTGETARLANYDVAGKTGTARKFENGRYGSSYTASFAAVFPAKDPQLVIVVKFDDPKKGSYYGGQTAAPVTKQMLERMLAARETPLGRDLAPDAEPLPVVIRDVRPPDAVAPVTRVAWPYRDRDTSAVAPVTVPDVAGRGVREAVLALHRKGLRVEVHGTGMVTRLDPMPGATVAAGTTIDLWTAE